jgi:hypothetical protein
MKNMLRVLLYCSLLYVGYYMLAGYVRTGEVELPPMVRHYTERIQQRILCEVPIGWRIGKLDPAFNLTRMEAEAVGRRAAALWNDAVGQSLFVYNDANGFPINFSYDERQYEILRETLLESNIASYDLEIVNSLDMLQFQEENLRQQLRKFAQEKEKLATDIASLQRQLAGGVPAQKLEHKRRQLMRWQNDLQTEAEWLNEQQRQLQWQQQNINATIRDRNDLLPTSQPPPVNFEMGLMQIDKLQRTMTIFAFHSHKDLVLTMAHEFGHALGLDHTKAADSLMYASFTTSQQDITVADLNAFSQQCA